MPARQRIERWFSRGYSKKITHFLNTAVPKGEAGQCRPAVVNKMENMMNIVQTLLLSALVVLMCVACASQEEVAQWNETEAREAALKVAVAGDGTDFIGDGPDCPSLAGYCHAVCTGAEPPTIPAGCPIPGCACPSDKSDVSTCGSGGTDPSLTEVPLESCELVDPGNDPYSIEGAKIQGDILVVEVTYSGGCVEHSFGACFGSFMESEPVQAGVVIGHLENNDPCDATVNEALAVKLSPLKKAYQESYGTPHGTIDVSLAGSEIVLEYSF